MMKRKNQISGPGVTPAGKTRLTREEKIIEGLAIVIRELLLEDRPLAANRLAWDVLDPMDGQERAILIFETSV